MEAEILKIIKATGVHIAGHGTVSTKWAEVNDLVFDSYPFAHVKEEHYKKGDFFKIKAKYESITKKAKATMGWGDFLGGKCENLSGYAGELSPVAKFIKDIEVEIEKNDAETQTKAADAAAQAGELQKITKDVFDGSKPSRKKKMKSLDGTIVDRSGSSSSFF
jgi:hypothetical protein